MILEQVTQTDLENQLLESLDQPRQLFLRMSRASVLISLAVGVLHNSLHKTETKKYDTFKNCCVYNVKSL